MGLIHIAVYHTAWVNHKCKDGNIFKSINIITLTTVKNIKTYDHLNICRKNSMTK